VDKLAAGVGMTSDTILDRLHRLQLVDRLAYALADAPGARP
jgi:hypothetical protein